MDDRHPPGRAFSSASGPIVLMPAFSRSPRRGRRYSPSGLFVAAGMGRGDLSDAEWERLRPFLPVSNGRCGRWRDHRQVIDGILHRVRTRVQWRDLPERFGPWKTVYERHRLWSAEGLHPVQVGAGEDPRPADRAGQTPQEPDSLAAGKAHGNGPCREYLRRRGIRHSIPEKTDSQAARLRRGSRGGRPPGFDEERYKNAIPSSGRSTGSSTPEPLRPVTTRYDPRGYVFLGTATAAALAIWLRT
jgi:putative transposase of IS4/5 family DUF4096